MFYSNVWVDSISPSNDEARKSSCESCHMRITYVCAYILINYGIWIEGRLRALAANNWAPGQMCILFAEVNNDDVITILVIAWLIDEAHTDAVPRFSIMHKSSPIYIRVPLGFSLNEPFTRPPPPHTRSLTISSSRG